MTTHEQRRSAQAAARQPIGMIALGFGRRYPGGAEHQAEVLSRELARRGRRILIYAPLPSTDTRPVAPAPPSMRVIPVPALGFSRTRTATFLPMLALMQLVPGFEHPRILHSHMAWYHAVLPQVLALVKGVRTLVKFACSGPDGEIATMSRTFAGRQALRIIGSADRLIALTSAVADELRFAGFDEGRIRVIPNGVSLPRPTPPAVDLERLRAPRVLLAGRLTNQKGVSEFLSAWANASTADDATLLVAGTGPLQESLQARAAEADLAGRVCLLGHRPDMGALFAASQLVVIPSRSEGMSNVALEALAAGTPLAPGSRWR